MADIRKAALDMGDVREFPLGKKRKNKITLHNKTKTKPGNNTCCTTQQHLVTWEHGPGKIILEKCAIQQKFAIYLALHMFSCLKRRVPNFQIAGEYDEIRVGLLKDSLSLSFVNKWAKRVISSSKVRRCIKKKCIEDNQDNPNEDQVYFYTLNPWGFIFYYFPVLHDDVKTPLDFMREKDEESRKLRSFLEKKNPLKDEPEKERRRTEICVTRLWDERVKRRVLMILQTFFSFFLSSHSICIYVHIPSTSAFYFFFFLLIFNRSVVESAWSRTK